MDGEFADFIKPELFILIPVLNIIGNWFKDWGKVKDKNIPLFLGIVGIALSGLYVFSTSSLNLSCFLHAAFVSLTQGALIAAASVYAHQIVKQVGINKTENGDQGSKK